MIRPRNSQCEQYCRKTTGYCSLRQNTNPPFKKLRLNVKLSQEKLAKKIGVAVSTIRRWEKGQAEPTMTIAQWKKFCQAVEKDFEDLPNFLSVAE